MNSITKKRDGFEGQKMISIPQKVWKDAIKKDAVLFDVYITHIGYFPEAWGHFRERRKGCEDNILIYCLKGKGHYVLDSKQYEVNAGEYVLIPATDKYLRYWADNVDPWTIYWVHFTGDKIQRFNNSLNLNPHKGPVAIPYNEKGVGIWQRIYQTLEMGYSQENLTGATFRLYPLVATFLFNERHLDNTKEIPADIITKTIMNMRDNLKEQLRIKDMADMHGISISHFTNLFRKATGMPPIDYFIHLKMQKACQLLYAPAVRVKTVATELGYDDPHYFSRIFKKYIGSSPEEYRNTTNNFG